MINPKIAIIAQRIKIDISNRPGFHTADSVDSLGDSIGTSGVDSESTGLWAATLTVSAVAFGAGLLGVGAAPVSSPSPQTPRKELKSRRREMSVAGSAPTGDWTADSVGDAIGTAGGDAEGTGLWAASLTLSADAFGAGLLEVGTAPASALALQTPRKEL